MNLYFFVANLASVVVCENVVVATYNLWNIMYHWEVRKLYIAEMIQNVGIDIIGFQEVRAQKDLKHTQLDELQELLPKHKYKYYVPVHLVELKYKQPPGWEWEGIGFLSKHEILMKDYKHLTVLPGNPDTNPRVMLYAQFNVHGKEINIMFNHFSYDKHQQCKNVHETLMYLSNMGVENTVLLGDFNAYEDFDTPADALKLGRFETKGNDECNDVIHGLVGANFHGRGYGFTDAWLAENPHHPGYTFSNMPVPGFINRPDRILVSKVGLRINSVLIRGKGPLYAQKYINSLWWARYVSVFETMLAQSSGKDWERTCKWDCGPHGSCRCGICISGGDQNNCHLADCSECSKTKLSVLYLIALLSILCFLTIICGVCLLVFGIVKPKWRRYLVNRLKVGRLVGKLTIVVAILFLMVLYKVLCHEFADIFALVSSQLYEELNPSDHLMVTANLEII